MTEKLVKTLQVQRKPTGGFQVTIPKTRVAEALGLKGGENLRVYFDPDKKSWRYELED